jgi:hypothetical protein
MATPHPADVHLAMSAHGFALNVDQKPVIAAAVIALRAERQPEASLLALEEEITRADLDYTRVPGHPIEIAESAALPPELAS